MSRANHSGYTLIEVMIVVVIIAILAAIAMPSYRSHICKVERNQAKSDLTLYAQALERFYTTNNFSYVGASNVFPAHSPSDGAAANKRFTLVTSASNATSFTLTATKTAGACSDAWVYTLTSAGTKTYKRGTATAITNWED
ncbi:MAG: type IV pilin protein [Marinagarivorans sp.]|nr:type IV pilin protein [Marinagarivorans sp.]